MLRRLIVALCVGAISAVGAVWFGFDQPGRWLTGAGRQPVGYDVFIHDHFMIVNPAAVSMNVVVFSAVVFSLASLIRSVRSGTRA